MKFTLILTLLLSLNFTVFGQTKFDEYGVLSSDDESARIDAMIGSLADPDTRGLIVIYGGADNERLGNLQAHLNGIKRYIDYRPNYLSRITLVLARGREKFNKELWIAKQDEEFPKFDAVDADLNNLTKKFLYAKSCLSCEPSIPELARDKINYSALSKLLNDNKNYQLAIYLHKQDLPTGVQIRNALRKEYGLSNTTRTRLRLIKKYDLNASFYLVPM